MSPGECTVGGKMIREVREFGGSQEDKWKSPHGVKQFYYFLKTQMCTYDVESMQTAAGQDSLKKMWYQGRGHHKSPVL